MLGSSVMRNAILGLVLLSACDPDVTQVGTAQYAIDGCRSTSDCYEAAAEQCPYGFDLRNSNQQTTMLVQNYGSTAIVTPITRSGMLVECRPPTFCDNGEACGPSSRCVRSHIYPGHRVCVI
jgi:hypothetical protein